MTTTSAANLTHTCTVVDGSNLSPLIECYWDQGLRIALVDHLGAYQLDYYTNCLNNLVRDINDIQALEMIETLLRSGRLDVIIYQGPVPNTLVALAAKMGTTLIRWVP